MKYFLCFFAFTLAAATWARAAKNGIEIVGPARFTVISPTLIRLEYAAQAKFVDAPSWFAANRDARFTAYETERDASRLLIKTGMLTLSYRDDGQPFHAGNLSITLENGTAWTPGAANKGNLGGTVATVDKWKEAGDLGEGILSTEGWYLLDDSASALIIADWPAARPATGGVDWYFFGYGRDFPQALRDLTRVGGSIPLPRKPMLGIWYSRYWNYSSEDFQGIVREYRENNFPLDVMVMDMDWHLTKRNFAKNKEKFAGIDGWTGYTFNQKQIPDPKALAQWFHQEGLTVTLNDHPAAGIQRHEECYPDFMRAMGADPASGKTIPFDAADRKYLDTFWQYSHAPIEDMGYDFWWLDWQQYPNTLSIPTLTNLAALNRYYFQASMRNGRRGLSFSRWAGWGDHRHPIHFSGDAEINWEMLAFEVPMTATAGNVGCYYWSHDIGGHMKGLGRHDELYTRWVQFGAVSPALRSHSAADKSLDRRPWTYAPWARDAMRQAFHLRAQLMPYIYTAAWQGYDQSLPLCRPMYLSGGPINEAQQYMLGDHLLVAPIAMPGHGPGKVAWQEVWLPAGDEWVNWFTGERFKGGQRILVTCDINTFPLFVRAGAAIPMQPYHERPTTAPLKTLIVQVRPASENKSVASILYEDDGNSDDYRQGKFSLSKIQTNNSGPETKITVERGNGQFRGQTKWTVEPQVIALAPDASLRAIEQRLAALLGQPVKLEKITDGLKHAQGELTEPVLACLGIGLVRHNNHPYLWNGPYEYRFYDTYGLVTNPPVSSGNPVGETRELSFTIDGQSFTLRQPAPSE